MDFAFILFIEIFYAISVLILISAGLAVVFGMMRVINLAHGEFITLGGYTVIFAHGQGINIYLAILFFAPLVVGIFGFLVERVIIRHLYGRLINTMLATWGLSLAMIGGMTTIFGNITTGISAPIGSYVINDYQLSGYNLFIIMLAVAIMLGIYIILKMTRWGIIARATMQDPDVAASFGYAAERVYMMTFVAGAALAGLAGGALAPLVGLTPHSGANYIAKAFITVIIGGKSIVIGLLSSTTILGFISQLLSFLATPVIGEVSLLSIAIILLLLLPFGISGRFFRNKV